jgi:hypothetical protein
MHRRYKIMKTCTKCGIQKNIDDFHNDKHQKDGKRFNCKTCANAMPQRRKKINSTCEGCGITKQVDYHSHKRRKSNYCLNCHSKIAQKGVKKPQFSRENSGRWNGGEYISSDGYKMIKCEGEFTASGRQKYKKEHVIVMEEFLGRELKTQKGGGGESVHHIDGDKLNNNIENLFICNSIEEHRKLHNSLEKISYELIKNGIIGFDNINKTYYIRNNNERS